MISVEITVNGEKIKVTKDALKALEAMVGDDKVEDVIVPEMVEVKAKDKAFVSYKDGDVEAIGFTYDYEIGKYQVTQEEYKSLMGENPSTSTKGDRNPVENVSWYDAIKYCNELSKKEGLRPAYDSEGNLLDSDGDITLDVTRVEGYRLPTDAEWEFAARGGTKSNGYKYSGSDNIDEVAWYSDNSDSSTHPVGEKKPNELGIYDMSGNVWEWCQDKA